MRRPIQFMLLILLFLGSVTLVSSQADAQECSNGDATLCLCTVNETTFQPGPNNQGPTPQTTTILHRFTYFDPSGVCLEHVLLPPDLQLDPPLPPPPPQDPFLPPPDPWDPPQPPPSFDLGPITHTQCQAMESEQGLCDGCPNNPYACPATCPPWLVPHCCH